jgi:hypothetical protein
VAEHALARAVGPDPGWSAPWDSPEESPFPVFRRWSAGSLAALAGLPSGLDLHPFGPVVEGVVDKLYGDPGAPLTLDPGTDLSDWQCLAFLGADGDSIGVGVGQTGTRAVSLRSLSEWAKRWCDPLPLDAPGTVECDPRLIRLVGRGGALIDAMFTDPDARVEDFQVVYDEGDPESFVSELVRQMGPRPFAERFGVLRQTAGEIARGRRPSLATVERVLGSLAKSDHDPRHCPECGAPVWRPGSTYCSTPCRERAKSRRRRQRGGPKLRCCAIPRCGDAARKRSDTCSERHRKALGRLRRANAEGADSLAPADEADR